MIGIKTTNKLLSTRKKSTRVTPGALPGGPLESERQTAGRAETRSSEGGVTWRPETKQGPRRGSDTHAGCRLRPHGQGLSREDSGRMGKACVKQSHVLSHSTGGGGINIALVWVLGVVGDSG